MKTVAKPMVPLPPTLEEADAKLAQIQEELKRLDILIQERNDWTAYRESLMRVTNQIAPPLPTPAPDTAPADGAKQPRRVFLGDGSSETLTTELADSSTTGRISQTNSGYLETDNNPHEILCPSKATAGSASEPLGISTNAGICDQGRA